MGTSLLFEEWVRSPKISKKWERCETFYKNGGLAKRGDSVKTGGMSDFFIVLSTKMST